MTERPTRATAAGRAYLDLQNLARRDHRPTDETHLRGLVLGLAAIGLDDGLEFGLDHVAVIGFADLAVNGSVSDRTWNAARPY